MINHTNNIPQKNTSNLKQYTSKQSSSAYSIQHQNRVKTQSSRLQKQNLMSQSSEQRYTVGSAYSNNQQLRHSIHDLMKEMQSALQSQKISHEENFYLRKSKYSEEKKSPTPSKSTQNHELKQPNTNPSEKQLREEKGFGMKKIKTLPQLEISIVQHILMLREEKITILEERNQIIDRKNQLQRQITKIKKKNNQKKHQDNELFITNASFKDSIQNSKISSVKDSPIAPKSVSPKYLQDLQYKNNYLKNQIQKLLTENSRYIPSNSTFDSIRLQDTRTMLEIEKYSRISSRIQDQINQQANPDVNRFQTFLPTQKRINLDSPSSHSSKMSDRRIWNNSVINSLVVQTQKLIKQANELICQKKQRETQLSLSVLQILAQLNEGIRNAFVQRVRREKQNLPLIKHQNQNLRSILGI